MRFTATLVCISVSGILARARLDVSTVIDSVASLYERIDTYEADAFIHKKFS
jgi:hypothetical protein